MLHALFVAASAVLALPATPALPAAGEPFADLSFDDALARATSESKLLLVDTTASWCPPCKRMEEDTWPDAGVRAWLAEHAVAIQVDVDEQRELAQKLGIQAMPTMIAFKDGEEFDRVVGYRDAAGLLAWLQGVAAGRRAHDGLAERADEASGGHDVDARYDLAKQLVRTGDHERALRELLWLWQNAERYEPAYTGVRRSFMLATIRQLCDAHEPSRAAFAELLAALDARVSSGPADFDAWADWFSMSQYLDDDATVLAWYEAERDEAGHLRVANLSGFLATYVPDEVFDVLMRHDRLADAGRLVGDFAIRMAKEMADYEHMHELHERMADERPDQGFATKMMREYPRRACLEQATRLYAAALAVQRPDDARAIAERLLGTFDDAETRLMLVDAALAHELPVGDDHAAWLDEAEALGANVATRRARVAAARAPAPDAPETR